VGWVGGVSGIGGFISKLGDYGNIKVASGKAGVNPKCKAVNLWHFPGETRKTLEDLFSHGGGNSVDEPKHHYVSKHHHPLATPNLSVRLATSVTGR
jgi:hypothetical protein